MLIYKKISSTDNEMNMYRQLGTETHTAVDTIEVNEIFKVNLFLHSIMLTIKVIVFNLNTRFQA